MQIDMINTPLNEGDEVIYTKSGRGEDDLLCGKVTEIFPFANTEYVSILTRDTNRTISRHRKKILNIEPIKAQHPENFI